MIRKLLTLMIAASATAAICVGVTASHASISRAQSTPSVYVTPASGSQFDTFSFTGSGFDAGAVLSETYTSPNGDQYTFYQADGTESRITAADDGTWGQDVHPATDFQGAFAGTWLVSFCLVNTTNCWSGTIDISL